MDIIELLKSDKKELTSKLNYINSLLEKAETSTINKIVEPIVNEVKVTSNPEVKVRRKYSKRIVNPARSMTVPKDVKIPKEYDQKLTDPQKVLFLLNNHNDGLTLSEMVQIILHDFSKEERTSDKFLYIYKRLNKITNNMVKFNIISCKVIGRSNVFTLIK